MSKRLFMIFILFFEGCVRYSIVKRLLRIASKLKVEDRIEILDDNDAYISIKDHKEGFPDKISCRLINPSKTNTGKISKQILDKVNTNILEKIKVNHWKNTSSVIEWYYNIKRKGHCSFVLFRV